LAELDGAGDAGFFEEDTVAFAALDEAGFFATGAGFAAGAGFVTLHR
jgi:hypothetical protein